jgi:hypothetical protein
MRRVPDRRLECPGLKSRYQCFTHRASDGFRVSDSRRLLSTRRIDENYPHGNRSGPGSSTYFVDASYECGASFKSLVFNPERWRGTHDRRWR